MDISQCRGDGALGAGHYSLPIVDLVSQAIEFLTNWLNWDSLIRACFPISGTCQVRKN